jgi:hypothetical protein
VVSLDQYLEEIGVARSIESQSDLDQANRSLPHPDDSRWAPACFDGLDQTDPDMLVGGLFPREDQRST